MNDSNNEYKQNQFINEAITKIQNIPGIDLIYFLSSGYHVIKEQKNTETNNYFQQVVEIIKLQPLADKAGLDFYLTPFHTYTFLNEGGLLVISKIIGPEVLYMVIIAGENEPVDLINLLKICKEMRLNFQSAQNTNV